MRRSEDLKVSIIIPTYNRAKYIERSLKSALKQTYDNKEIIIVDDASTDNTEELLKKYANEIRYIKLDRNSGAANARNIGIDEASGEIIGFLDSDDIWYPYKLEKQIEKFDEKTVLVYSALKIDFVNFGLSYSTKPSISGYVYKKMLVENYIGATPSVLVRKEALEKVGKFDCLFNAREEYDLWIKLSKLGKVAYLNMVTCESVNHDGDERISSDISNYEKAVERLNEKYKNEVKRELTPDLREKRLSEQYYFLASQAAKVNNKQAAFRYFTKSISEKFNFKSMVGFFVVLFSPRLLVKLRSVVK